MLFVPIIFDLTRILIGTYAPGTGLSWRREKIAVVSILNSQNYRFIEIYSCINNLNVKPAQDARGVVLNPHH